MDGNAVIKRMRRTVSSAIGVPIAGVLLFSGWSLGVESESVGQLGAQRGGIAGTVTFTGTVPEAVIVDLSKDAYCLAAHPGEVVVTRSIVVDAAGGLGDVIVYVKEGVAGGDSPVPSEPVVLDQEGCVYSPSAVALQVGQTMVIRNSDATLHNVRVSAQENRGFNIGQPMRGIESRRTFPNPELGIGVRCDIHGWMNAVIGVFDHPFFAVTSVDGRFRLEGLPPGEYVLEAWHKTLGAKVQTVVVGDGVAEASFVF